MEQAYINVLRNKHPDYELIVMPAETCGNVMSIGIPIVVYDQLFQQH